MKPLLLKTSAFVAVLAGGIASQSAHALGPAFVYSDAPQESRLLVRVNGGEVAQGAEAFISNLAEKGTGVLADPDVSGEKQKSAFRKLLNANFDMNTIARFSLGRYWRTASPAQRDEYMNLFKNMIIEVYSARFKDYEGQKIEVVGSRQENEKDILVHSLLKQPSGPDVKVDWRVRHKSGKYQVVDVIVEGVSMALTQRSDFASVIQRGGGEVEALLANLREK